MGPRRDMLVPKQLFDLEAEGEICQPFENWSNFRKGISHLVQHQIFKYVMYIVILLNCLVISLSNLGPFVHHEHVIWLVEDVVSCIFFVELIFNLIGIGFRRYWLDGWRMLDGVISIICFASFVVRRSASDQASVAMMTALFALRALRPLRVLSMSSSLRCVLESIWKSVHYMKHVIFLWAIFIFVMSLIALEFFKGKLSYRCVSRDIAMQVLVGNLSLPLDPHGDETPVCTLGMPFNYSQFLEPQNLLFSAEPPSTSQSYVCPHGMYCVNSLTPQLGYTNFDSLFSTLVTLYTLTALDGWSFVMYYVMDALGWPLVASYWFIIEVGGAIVIMNLALAIISEAFGRSLLMAQLKAAAEAARLATPLVERSSTQFDLPGEPRQTACQHLFTCFIGLRKFVRDRIVLKRWFQIVTGIVIAANTVTLSLVHYQMSQELVLFIRWTSIVCTSFYTLEILLKFLGLTFREIMDPLNIFDISVTIGSLLEIMVTDSATSAMGVLRSVRCFRIITVIPTLRRTLKTLVAALRMTFSLCVLFVLVAFLFALVGMQLYQGKMCDIDTTSPFRVNTTFCGNVPRGNFDNMGYAFTTVFITIAGDGWRTLMTQGEKGAGRFTAVFFVLCQFTGGYFVLNLFIAVLLSNKEAEQQAKDEELDVKDAPTVEMSEKREESFLETFDRLEGVENVLLGGEGEERRLWHQRKQEFIEKQNFVRRTAGNIVRSRWFTYFITAAILLSMFLLTFTIPTRYPDDQLARWLGYADVACAVVFVCEALLKLLHYGIWQPRDSAEKGYFQSGWNAFDFFLMLWMTLSVAFSIGRIGNRATIQQFGRFSRAIRPWSLVGRYKPLHLVFRSLVNSLPHLRNAALIAAFVWFIFAIMGTQLYYGGFYACTNQEWGDVTYNSPWIETEVDCRAANYSWTTTRANFDNVGRSMITLFQVATISNWEVVMYAATDALGPGVAPKHGNTMYAPLYFFAFIVAISFFIINFFISVLVEAYFKTKATLEENIKHSLVVVEDFDVEQQTFVVMYRRALYYIRPPLLVSYDQDSFRYRIRILIRSKWFEWVIFALVIFQVGMVALTYSNEPHLFTQVIFIVDVVATFLFFLASIMKLIAYGFQAFFEQYRNNIDSAINVVTIVGIALELIMGATMVSRGLRMFRMARLYRVFFVSTGVMLMLRTIRDSVKSFIGVAILLGLFVFAYAVVGMSLFGRVMYSDDRNGFHRFANFDRFDIAMMTLTRVATTDNWPPLMWAASVEQPQCDPNLGECGHPVIAPVFFLSFIICGSWILLRCFTAVLLEAFSHAEEEERYAIQKEDVVRFRRLWKVCSSREDYHAAMTFQQLLAFLKKLGPPIGPDCDEVKTTLACFRFLYKLDLPVTGDKVLQMHVFDALVRYFFGMKLPAESESNLALLIARRFREKQMIRSPLHLKLMSKTGTLKSLIDVARIQARWRGKLVRRQQKRELESCKQESKTNEKE